MEMESKRLPDLPKASRMRGAGAYDHLELSPISLAPPSDEGGEGAKFMDAPRPTYKQRELPSFEALPTRPLCFVHRCRCHLEANPGDCALEIFH